MTDHATYLDLAQELADLADARTMTAFRGHLDVRTKRDGTWVTEVDETVERELRDAIRSRFPDHAVLGEEDGLDGPDDAPRWVLDPIDGTTNFVKGNPIFATLIGLQVDGRDVVGVASAPALGTRFDAVHGGPAHQDGHPIRVSDTARLADAEVALGDLRDFAERGLFEGASTLARTAARQRGYGDFWQHCLVAAGSTDVAAEATVSLWDLVAVKVIVEAAGGTFTDLDGTATADGGSAVSTNTRLHAEVLDVLRARAIPAPATP